MAIRIITVDVSELQYGDIIVGCEEMGPVKWHRPNVNFPETQEMVSWVNGGRDFFGKPQRLDILRIPPFPAVSEEFAAELELAQSRRDYRETWWAAPYSANAESSAWHYTNSAYRAWAKLTN